MTGPARREAVELPVEIVLEEGRSSVSGMTVNLSESGMLVVAEAPVPPGEELRFRASDFDGHAKAVWVHEGERGSRFVGLTFTRLSDEARARVRSILASADLEYRPGGPRPGLRFGSRRS